MSKREKIVSICFIAVVFLAAAYVCRPVFYLNDDVTMRSILSGNYTGSPDGHAVYMKYPLTWLLALLYKMAKAVPWMELFFAVCLLSSAYVCGSKISSQKRGKILLTLGAVLFVLPFFWYMHYTMIAAVLSGTAAICLSSEDGDMKAVVFWILAWMIRSQVAYLALPYLGVAVLWRFVGIKRAALGKHAVKAAKVYAVFLLGLLLCMGLNGLAYKDQSWKRYLEYNEARTQLYDYTDFHSTDKYAQNFEQYGMTKEEFLVLDSYNTLLDAEIDVAKIGLVADKVTTGMEEKRAFAVWVKDCVLKYYYEIRYSDHVYAVVWVAILLVLTVMLLLGKCFWDASLIFCLEAGRSLIWIYLIGKGRFPERVVVSLYVIEILLLVGMLSHLPEGCKEQLSCLRQKMEEKISAADMLKKVFRTIFVLMICLILSVQAGADMKRAKLQGQTQDEWSVLKEFCDEHPQNLYLIDVFSAVEYGGLQYRADIANMMLAGGWMSASPLAQQRFESLGVLDGAQALFEIDSVFFVTEENADLDWLEDYMDHRFGQCELSQVDEIVCSGDKVFVVYNIKK